MGVDDVLGPCVEFAGYITPYGYGQRRYNGKNQQAHRIAYCEHHGVPIESIAGLVVRHRCDNRRCIKPAHLEIGTQAENIADMDRRGRRVTVSLRGGDNASAVLTPEQVEEVRRDYVRYSKTHGAVAFALRFNVDRTTILRVARGDTWNTSDDPKRI